MDKVLRDFVNEKLGKVVFKLSTFILTVVLVRILTPEEYGIYLTCMAFALSITALIDLNYQESVPRYIARNRGYYRAFLLLFLKLSLIALVFIAALLPFLSSTMFKGLGFFYPLASFLIAFSLTLACLVKSYFIAVSDFKSLRNACSVEGVLKLAVIVSLALLFSVNGAILGVAVCYILFSLIFFPRGKVKNRAFFTRSDYIYLFLLALTGISRGIYDWIDALIIASMLSFSDVAIYRISFAFISTFSLLSSFSTVYIPRIVKELRVSKKFFLYSSLTTAACSLVFVLFGKIALHVIYGEFYTRAYVPVLLLIPALFFINLNIFPTIFNIAGKPQITASITIACAGINALLDILLISSGYGVEGACIATSIASGSGLLLSAIVYKKKIRKRD